ncbi:MAG: AraC family transcriptional regulator [Clostridiales Family XIII bacterium]|nr:AraC family transcriptional regulator [Clostridiales Family XIII bacterium]
MPDEEAVLLTAEVFKAREHADFHTPSEFENIAIAAIEAGDPEALLRFYKMPIKGRLGKLSLNPLQQEKFLFVALVTLASRAAIRGGLDEEVARALSGVYCRRADAMRSVQEIQDLSYKMGMHFCHMVARSSGRPQYSPTIERCRTYISQHLHKAISLPELAGVSGFSPHTISRKFRAETGYSITDYINRKKIEEAASLLRHSNMSISEIANYLQYCTQSYFTKIFKEITGVTPRKFREGGGDIKI